MKGNTERELSERYLVIATEGWGEIQLRCQGNVYGKSVRELRFKSFGKLQEERIIIIKK